jgi:hypothetical protein
MRVNWSGKGTSPILLLLRGLALEGHTVLTGRTMAQKVIYLNAMTTCRWTAHHRCYLLILRKLCELKAVCSVTNGWCLPQIFCVLHLL